MALLVKFRSLRLAVLVLYGLIAGMDQGLHVFADAEQCRAAHCQNGLCDCCGPASPFARFRDSQLDRLGDSVHLERSDHQAAGCSECVICQSLSQLVARTATPAALPFLTPSFSITKIAEQRGATSSQVRLPEGRGPPADVAFV